jgi:phage shock protein A
MNKIKFFFLAIILLVPLGGCGEDGTAAVDVLKKRLTNEIQGLIGKGDIAIQKYENKIAQVKDSLIKVKVSRKSFERKLAARKASLASKISAGASEKQVAILKNTIEEMEKFLKQVQIAEDKLLKTYRKLKDNLDIVKMKVAALEAKRDMLDALRTIQQYSNIEGEIDNVGMDSTFDNMQKEIDAIEAEIEIDSLLTQAEKMEP